jgi:hypothetical protein
MTQLLGCARSLNIEIIGLQNGEFPELCLFIAADQLETPKFGCSLCRRKSGYILYSVLKTALCPVSAMKNSQGSVVILMHDCVGIIILIHL